MNPERQAQREKISPGVQKLGIKNQWPKNDESQPTERKNEGCDSWVISFWILLAIFLDVIFLWARHLVKNQDIRFPSGFSRYFPSNTRESPTKRERQKVIHEPLVGFLTQCLKETHFCDQRMNHESLVFWTSFHHRNTFFGEKRPWRAFRGLFSS